jgi:hypothetical protein
MKRVLLILGCLLMFSACQKARELRSQWGEKMGVMEAQPQEGRKIEGSAYYSFPEVTPGKQYKSESSFCYKVQTDILCYDQPRSGWEDRMVGYQEPMRPVSSASGYGANDATQPYSTNATGPVPTTVAPVVQVQQQPLGVLPQVTLTE